MSLLSAWPGDILAECQLLSLADQFRGRVSGSDMHFPLGSYKERGWLLSLWVTWLLPAASSACMWRTSWICIGFFRNFEACHFNILRVLEVYCPWGACSPSCILHLWLLSYQPRITPNKHCATAKMLHKWDVAVWLKVGHLCLIGYCGYGVFGRRTPKSMRACRSSMSVAFPMSSLEARWTGCCARHDSSDGRSSLHTIRIQLKRSHSWGKQQTKHQKNNTKNTPKNRQTTPKNMRSTQVKRWNVANQSRSTPLSDVLLSDVVPSTVSHTSRSKSAYMASSVSDIACSEGSGSFNWQIPLWSSISSSHWRPMNVLQSQLVQPEGCPMLRKGLFHSDQDRGDLCIN